MKHVKHATYLALLSISIATGAVVAKPPRPIPTEPAFVYYFADAARTEYVGRDVITCEGLRYLEWGARTSYSDTVPRDGCGL